MDPGGPVFSVDKQQVTLVLGRLARMLQHMTQ